MKNKIKGLSEAEAIRSREEHGANVHRKAKSRGLVKRFLENLGDPIIKILLIALALEVIFTFGNCNLFEVFGIVSEEIDTLYPHEKLSVEHFSGRIYDGEDYCELIHTRGAEVLSRFENGTYKAYPALTLNFYKKGRAYYQAFRDTYEFKAEIIGNILDSHGIASLLENEGSLPHGVTAHTRTDGETTYLFVENYSDRETYTLSLRMKMENMLNGEKTKSFTLMPYSFYVFKTI